jgi:glycine cleavage system H protein
MDPYGDGWMVRLRVRDASEMEQLLNADNYGQHVGQ